MKKAKEDQAKAAEAAALKKTQEDQAKAAEAAALKKAKEDQAKAEAAARKKAAEAAKPSDTPGTPGRAAKKAPIPKGAKCCRSGPAILSCWQGLFPRCREEGFDGGLGIV